MMFAVAFLLQFVVGGLSGVTFAAAPIDWQVTDTYYLVAHFSLRALRRHGLRDHGGDVLLVSEDDAGACSRRGSARHALSGSMVLGFNADDLLRAARARGSWGCPAACSHLPRPAGVGRGEPRVHGGRVHHGDRRPRLPRQHRVEPAAGRGRGRQPRGSAWTLEWATTSPPPDCTTSSRACPRYTAGRSGRSKLISLTPQSQARRDTRHRHDAAGREARRVDVGLHRVGGELLSFVVLILAYVFYNAQLHGAVGGATAATKLDVTNTAGFTVCLLASSAERSTSPSKLLEARQGRRERALADGDGLARRRVPRRPGPRVLGAVRGRDDRLDQPVRDVVLHAHGLSRAARHARPGRAVDRAGPSRCGARSAPAPRSGRSACTGTSWTSSGWWSSPSCT